MIIKYLSVVPIYETPLNEDIDLQLNIREALELYQEHIQMPFIQKITDIISITPQHLRQHNWNYIDNIKYASVYNGYLNDFGEGTHLDIEYISGECEKLSIEDTAYLLNDNGKTIETLNKGKPINYDRHKVAILMKYIKGEYNQGQLFKELDLYYSGDKKVSEE